MAVGGSPYAKALRIDRALTSLLAVAQLLPVASAL